MNQGNDQTDKQQEHVTITATEMRRLRQLEMERDLQDSLDLWAKKRFRTALIAVSVFGFIGIQAMGYVLIDQLLGREIDDAKFESRLLQKTAEQIESEASSAKARAMKALDRATEKVSELTMQATALDQKLRVALAKSRAVSEGVRAETLLDIQRLQKQIDAITIALDENGMVGHAPSRISQQQNEIKEAFNRQKQSFQNNSEYSVDVLYEADREGDARLLIERMRKLGFEMRDIGAAGLPGGSPTERESVSLLAQKYGENIVISPNDQKNKYVRSALSSQFPDWEFRDTVQEQHDSNSTNIVFWGLNIVLL
jgi:hypothetical protein